MRAAIRELCNRNVVTATANATVAEAAGLMRQHHIGALVIVEERAGGVFPIGVVTDRDIVIEVVAAGLAPQTVKATEIVQRAISTVREDDGYEDTIRLMSINGVRRMPVVDAAGRLAGIVTLDDILHHLVGSLASLGDLTDRERRYEAKTRQ